MPSHVQWFIHSITQTRNNLSKYSSILIKKKAIPKWHNLSSDPRSIYIKIINEKHKIMQQKSTKTLYI